MRKEYIEWVGRKISLHARSRMQRVFPDGVRGIFNFRCHQNCVQWIHDHPNEGLQIAEVIYLPDGNPSDPILHYLVRDRDGKFLEVTLGYEADQNEYFLIRMVPECEWKSILTTFNRSLHAWTVEWTNPVIRFFLCIRRIV